MLLPKVSESMSKKVTKSDFSQILKIGNSGIIANFVFLYIYSFLPYLHHMLLVNVEFDINAHKGIIF